MKKLADKRKKYILECIAFCVVVGLDQLTKKLAEIHLMHTDTFPILEGVLHLTYVENTGASFGILKNHRWIFLVFSSIAILGILIFLFLKSDRVGTFCCVSLSVICGGGVGNMIDRLWKGYVIDFIDFRLIHFAVFNVADSFVCVGVALLAICILFVEKHE